jgi:phosphoenolpyruvate synthase/pyruvate phosphate dikinase
MDYVRSLRAIYRIDEHLVGERAVDLAVLAEKGYAVPLTFVVTNETFEAFVIQNKLQAKIGAALLGTDAKAVYDAIRELIIEAPIPPEVVHDVADAYEGLSIDADAPVNKIIKSGEPPLVNLFLSPNYTLPSESTEGIILNVRGTEQLLLAVKECWACLFTPRIRRHRREEEIGERNLNTGVIVQHMARGDLSAEAWSAADGNVEEISVKAYYGAPDSSHTIGKDEWRLSREYLKPVYRSIGIQTEMFARDEEDRLDKVPIGERGEKQKLPDREVMELARLAKKANILLERPVKLLFDVEDETVLTLLCNRLTMGRRYEAEERIEETVLFQTPKRKQTAPATKQPPAEAEKPSEEPTDEPAKEPSEEVAAETAEEQTENSEMNTEGGEEWEKKEESEGSEQEKDEGRLEPEMAGKDESAPKSMEAPAAAAEEENEAASPAAEEAAAEEEFILGEPASEAGPAGEGGRTVGEYQGGDAGPAEQFPEPPKGRQWSMDEAYEAVVAALRSAYEERYRHPPPTDAFAVYQELTDEINLPYEEQIGRLLRRDEQPLTSKEEEELLAIINDFLSQMT